MLDRGIFVTTAQFEASTPQEHFINERCFGEDFAEWLRIRLTPLTTSVSEPIQEDWGWALVAEYEGSHFTIAIGVMDDAIGTVPAQWRVGVSYERWQNLRALFRRPPQASFDALADVVFDILHAEPEMKVEPED
jgi:hypothetical protein